MADNAWPPVALREAALDILKSNAEYNEQAHDHCLAGATNTELAELFAVSARVGSAVDLVAAMLELAAERQDGRHSGRIPTNHRGGARRA